MSIWEQEGEDGEEENGLDEEDEFKSSIDRIIFLIDARSPMLGLNGKGETHLQNSLQVALEVMKTKVIAQDASSVGVTFFGTRETDTTEGTENIFTLFPLGPPSAKNIRLLQQLVEDIGEFERIIGSQSAVTPFCPLKQAFWACSQSFGTKDLKATDFKRIWIFTNDDAPNAEYPVEQRALVTVAKDCAQTGVELSLWHIPPARRAFDLRRFYTDLLRETVPKGGAEDDEPGDESQRVMGAGGEGFDIQCASVRRRQFRKRRLNRMLFSFSDRPLEGDAKEVYMCMYAYKPLQIVKRPLHVWLSARTHRPLTLRSRFLDGETGETVDAPRIENYIDAQGCPVPVSREDLLRIKQRDPWLAQNPTRAQSLQDAQGLLTLDKKDPLSCALPALRLLFTMPRKALPDSLNLTTPYFLYPGEAAVQGSAALFEALLRALQQREEVCVVRFTRTLLTGHSRLAVLLPQTEQVDPDSQMQLRAPGLWLLPLPGMEDLRFHPNPQTDADGPDARDEEVREEVREVVRALSLPEDFEYSRDVDGPALQSFYAALQAVALGEEALAWSQASDTLTLSAALASSAAQAATRLATLLGADGDAEEAKGGAKGGAKKSTARAAPASRAKKEVKKEADEGVGEEVQAPKRKRAVKKEVVEEVEEVQPSSRGRRAATKKRSYAEDDDDEAVDEEEVQPQKKKRAPAKRTAKKTRDDDDEDDFEF